jgi:hypothetical protein
MGEHDHKAVLALSVTATPALALSRRDRGGRKGHLALNQTGAAPGQHSRRPGRCAGARGGSGRIQFFQRALPGSEAQPHGSLSCLRHSAAPQSSLETAPRPASRHRRVLHGTRVTGGPRTKPPHLEAACSPTTSWTSSGALDLHSQVASDVCLPIGRAFTLSYNAVLSDKVMPLAQPRAHLARPPR